MSQLLAVAGATAPVATPTVGAAPSRHRSVPTGQRRALAGVALVVVAVGAALPFSLLSLAEDYQHGAVLGELVLVPLCAAALAVVSALRHPWVADLRAGRADYAVSACVGSIALVLLALGPVTAGNHYYAMRPDLLALPLIAVAAVCLVFGVRALVAFVAPLAVLTLAWPLPLRAAVEPVTTAVVSLTSAAVQHLLAVLPLATVVSAPGDLRLTVTGPQGPFDVLVASACSGVGGITGMLLIGLCAQYVLHGPVRARLLWLAAGVALAWSLNVVRIMALLGLGAWRGQHVALDVVHPVAGLVLLNAALLVLLLTARRFGLVLALRRRAPYDTPLTAAAAPDDRMRRAERARRAGAMVAGVLVLAAAGTSIPVTAAAYQAGVPAVTAFAHAPELGPRFTVTDGQEKVWARAYFGADSSWMRYRARPTSGAVGYSMWVDSVLTADWSGLRAHPLLDCYEFHGFELVSTARPTLAAGILADQVVYRRADGATWHVLSWEWPVTTPSGELAHERVTLLASSSSTDVADGLAPSEGDGGLRGALARRLQRTGSGTDPNPALTAALRADAATAVAGHVAAGTTRAPEALR